MPPTGGPVSVVGARLINVSPFGMMIESLVPMKTDALLPLRLLVEGRKIDVETRVAACTVVASSERRKVFGIGLEFMKIPGEVQDRLRQMLYGLPRFEGFKAPPRPGARGEA